VSTTIGIEVAESIQAVEHFFSRMQRWDLLELDAPAGTRDPIVLHSDDGARAVLVVLTAGQSLGNHQVRENAWVVVLEGSLEVAAATGETFAAPRGTLVRFEPGERHSLTTAEGARVLLVLAPWPAEGHFPAP
jgi:quercetin dioxygenase-like cupin family protein